MNYSVRVTKGCQSPIGLFYDQANLRGRSYPAEECERSQAGIDMNEPRWKSMLPTVVGKVTSWYMVGIWGKRMNADDGKGS